MGKGSRDICAGFRETSTSEQSTKEKRRGRCTGVCWPSSACMDRWRKVVESLELPHSFSNPICWKK